MTRLAVEKKSFVEWNNNFGSKINWHGFFLPHLDVIFMQFIFFILITSEFICYFHSERALFSSLLVYLLKKNTLCVGIRFWLDLLLQVAVKRTCYKNITCKFATDDWNKTYFENIINVQHVQNWACTWLFLT